MRLKRFRYPRATLSEITPESLAPFKRPVSLATGVISNVTERAEAVLSIMY